MGRRGRFVGAVVAVGALAAIAALAWWLVNRPAERPAFPGAAAGSSSASATAGRERTPGGPGGFGFGGRGGPSTVGIATATTTSLPVSIDAIGTVTPRVVATVRPQVSGVLTQVLFEEGQLVKKGQLLATIDARPFEIALQQAIGARMRDEALLENAKLTLERFRTLLGQDSIARQEVDTQASSVKQLEGTLVIDRANEATARLNVAWARVTAPVSGRVGLRPVDIGNVVSSADAAGIAVITQLMPIDVEFAMPQDRLPEIRDRVASGATLPVAAFDRTRTTKLGDGVFSTVDNQIDTTTGTIKAKARFANAQGTLFPNQFVNVRLLLDTVDRVVVVPVTALRQGADGPYVYVLGDDRTVAVRNVERGISTNDRVAITRGLKAGERVVTEGGDRLKDGASVQLAGERPASSASAGRRGASAPAEAGSGERQRRRRDAAVPG